MKYIITLLALWMSSTAALADLSSCEEAIATPGEIYVRTVAQLATLQRDFNATEYTDPITGNTLEIDKNQIKSFEILWERATNFLYPLRLITHFGVDHLLKNPNQLLMKLSTLWYEQLESTAINRAEAGATPAPTSVAATAANVAEESPAGSYLQFLLSHYSRRDLMDAWDAEGAKGEHLVKRRTLDYLMDIPEYGKSSAITIVGAEKSGKTFLMRKLLSMLQIRELDLMHVLTIDGPEIEDKEIVSLWLNSKSVDKKFFRVNGKLEKLVQQIDSLPNAGLIVIADEMDNWDAAEYYSFLDALNRFAAHAKNPGSFKVIVLERPEYVHHAALRKWTHEKWPLPRVQNSFVPLDYVP